MQNRVKLAKDALFRLGGGGGRLNSGNGAYWGNCFHRNSTRVLRPTDVGTLFENFVKSLSCRSRHVPSPDGTVIIISSSSIRLLMPTLYELI